MESIDKIFSYYDQLISKLPTGYQALISLLLVIFLIWNIYQIIKGGHWIFLAILVVLLPGTWPAAKNILFLIWTLIKGLFLRSGV